MTLLLAGCPWDSTKPNPPADITLVSGTALTAVAGSAIPVPPVVKVLDADGAGIKGVTVNWIVTTGGGSLSVAKSQTNADGYAEGGIWTLGKIVGTNTVSASVDGLQKSATFLAIAVAGPPALIAINAGSNQTSAAGTTVPIPPSVRVSDVNGNAVGGTTVRFTVTSGGGSVIGSNTSTNFIGIASATSWRLGPTSGMNTVSAGFGDVAPVTFTATATAPPTQVVITRQPSGAIDGEPFDVQPVVAIRDADNNVVTTSNATVVASIDSGAGTLTGTTGVTAVNGVAAFTNLAIAGSSAVTLRFTATGLTAGISQSLTPTPPPPLNLTIDNVHLTQATQTYDGAVPIVAGRAALARVFVKANVQANTATPAVRLRTFVNGSLFRTYIIAAPRGSVPKLMDEATLTASWNVLIPAEEVVGGMSVLADVDPANAVVESSDTDNTFPASGTPLALNVRQVPTMKVTFVPVSQPGIAAGNVTEANKNDLMDYAKRVYPFDTTDVVVHAPLAFNALLGSAYDNGWTSLLSQVNAMRVAEGTPDRYYYGLAHPSYQSGGTGLGSIGVPAAVGMDFPGLVQPSTTTANMTIAHEWGHNFGRSHVACGNPSGTDQNYPYDPLTSVGTTGYDLPLGVIRKSSDYREFMSYCQPLWISDYTYKAVLAYRGSTAEPPPAAGQGVLLVWGRVAPTGVVLEPAYEIQAPAQLPREAGPYSLEALDESGRRVFAISFAGAEVDHMPGERSFAFAIPMPALGARPATLRLLSGGRELTRRARKLPAPGGATTSTAASPTRLVSLGANRSRLEWDATSYPGAMVRDAATGQVLAFLSGGRGEIVATRDVEVLFSTGVTSVRRYLSR